MPQPLKSKKGRDRISGKKNIYIYKFSKKFEIVKEEAWASEQADKNDDNCKIKIRVFQMQDTG
jgi:hypothetical protein